LIVPGFVFTLLRLDFYPQDKALSRMLDSESSSESESEEKKDNKEDENEEEENAKEGGKKGKKKKDAGDGKQSNKTSANNSRATTPTPGKLDQGILKGEVSLYC
jgi:hypothetical protein